MAKTNMTIHVEPELKELIIKLAEKDGRSMGGLLRVIIDQYLESRGISLENVNSLTRDSYHIPVNSNMSSTHNVQPVNIEPEPVVQVKEVPVVIEEQPTAKEEAVIEHYEPEAPASLELGGGVSSILNNGISVTEMKNEYLNPAEYDFVQKKPPVKRKKKKF